MFPKTDSKNKTRYIILIRIKFSEKGQTNYDSLPFLYLLLYKLFNKIGFVITNIKKILIHEICFI